MSELSMLYDRDYYGWTQAAARALRNGTVSLADLQLIAEEVEDMGKSERRAVASRLGVLAAHLLKWRYQPTARSRSWRLTIAAQRKQLQQLLDENPSLRRELSEILTKKYGAARDFALAETQLPDEALPVECPFDVAEVLEGELE